MPSNNEYKIITNGNAIEIIDRVNNFIKINGGALILFHPTYRNGGAPPNYYAIIEYKP